MDVAKISALCEMAGSAMLSFNQSTIAISLLLIFFGITIILVTTYLFTVCRFYVTRGPRSRFKGNEPPTLPYWIPFVGNAFLMISDPHKFFEQTL